MESLTGIIGIRAFSRNVHLETVILPSTVETLGFQTLSKNSKLYSVNLEHVKHFGNETFESCYAMRNFDMRSMESSHEWSLYTELADPPQVVTLQNTDQLIMLVGPDSDEYSNQFTTRTFHFITGYTEEDLAPFSEKYPKWTLVPSHVSASSGGDPYVFPLVGPVYKLPNCDGLRASSIVAYAVVSLLLLLFLVGVYIHYRSGRGKK